MASYRLSPKAAADLECIWLYGLQHWGVTQADKYIEALYQRFSELVNNPRQYPAVDEIYRGYRRSVCGSDSIYYRIDGADVEIMAVIGRQDLGKWL